MGEPKHRAEPTGQRPVMVLVEDEGGDWPNSGAVAEALLRAWMELGQAAAFTVITYGRQTGAEQMAHTVAGQRGWSMLELPQAGSPRPLVDRELVFRVGKFAATPERTVHTYSLAIDDGTAQ